MFVVCSCSAAMSSLRGYVRQHGIYGCVNVLGPYGARFEAVKIGKNWFQMRKVKISVKKPLKYGRPHPRAAVSIKSSQLITCASVRKHSCLSMSSKIPRSSVACCWRSTYSPCLGPALPSHRQHPIRQHTSCSLPRS